MSKNSAHTKEQCKNVRKYYRKHAQMRLWRCLDVVFGDRIWYDENRI